MMDGQNSKLVSVLKKFHKRTSHVTVFSLCEVGIGFISAGTCVTFV
jgi:hypothetical protein